MLSKKNLSPVDAIISDFHKWNKGKGVKHARYSITKSDFQSLSSLNASWSECNFLDLLPSLIIYDRKEDIKKIIAFIACTICKYEWKRGPNNPSLDNKKAFIKRFLKYIESKRNLKQLLANYKSQIPPLSANDENKLNQDFIDRIIYSHSDLRTKFKIRLRCQDRTSGDKIWLPLRFISKIYNKTGDFNNWLDLLVDHLFIHYLDSDGKTVKSTTFKKASLYLELVKNNNIDYTVNVIFSKNMRFAKWYPALTPTGNGAIKERMKVDCIDSIVIDHVKPIDQTLKDLEPKLKNLKLVSDVYRLMPIPIVSNLTKNPNFNSKGLLKELKLIRNDGPLRLMASKYNSQKSNSSTFQAIIKDVVSGELLGILEWKNVILDDSGDQCYYYQKLTNDITQNAFRISTTKPTGNPISGRNALERIIDFI